MKIIIWKDGTYKEVNDNSSFEYENDKDWLLTLPYTDKWVSVQDELPDDKVEVEIWIENYTNNAIVGYYSKNTNTWFGSAELRSCMKDGYVNDETLLYPATHWKPLTQPTTT